MNKKRVLVIIFVLVITVGLLSAKDGSFTIIHMNDTHSYLLGGSDEYAGREFGGAARWKTIIDDLRGGRKDVLTLHAGDFLTGSGGEYLTFEQIDYDRFPLYGWRGATDVLLLNMLGFDAVTLGNHEFDYGLSWLLSILKPAKFSVLAANLDLNPIPPTKEFKKLSPVKEYEIFTRGEVKVAVIGLVTNDYLKSLQVKIRSAEETLRTLIPKVRKKADIVVVLSHLGYQRDIEVARAVDGIDLIVGGHSHTRLSTHTVENNTYITQTGAWGSYVGVIDLHVKDKAIDSIDYRLIPTPNAAENEEVLSFIEEYKTTGLALDRDLSTEDGSLYQWILDTVQKRFRTHGAIIIGRLIKEGELKKGVVPSSDFFSIFWPYRARTAGAERDMLGTQIIDVLTGDYPRSVRSLLSNGDWVSPFVVATVTQEEIEAIKAFNDRNVIAGDYLHMSFDDHLPKKPKIALDLQTYRLLLLQGVLDPKTGYTLEDGELFEVMLDSTK